MTACDMKENLYNKANKANSKEYNRNYDKIFKQHKKRARESLKVQRSKQGAYLSKRNYEWISNE